MAKALKTRATDHAPWQMARPARRQTWIVLAFAAVFVIGGVMALQHFIEAAGDYVSVNITSGARVGDVAEVSSSGAAGGKAIEFGPSIAYVALGDSVASGEGINYGWAYANGNWIQSGPKDPVWEPTADTSAAVQDCHRSSQAYPYLFASSGNYQLLDLSCSGASIPGGVLGPISFGGGVSGAAQLGSNASGDSPPNAAYDSFKPQLVTITLGMDDVDFSDVLTNCYTGPCGTAQQTQTLASALATFSTNLKTVLAEIDRRGTADGYVPWVILTTYYNPFNPSDISCGDVDLGLGFGLSASDVSWIETNLATLNQDITADAVAYPKAKVVDLTNVMTGHQLCSSEPWVYGPSILEDDLSSPAPFHPTPQGQQAIAGAIESAASTLSY